MQRTSQQLSRGCGVHRSAGWKIGEAVERIWRGERNEVSLVAGADANSAAMISRILTHAHHIEVTFGPAKRVEFRPLLRAQLE
jgi:hypothetical protein